MQRLRVQFGGTSAEFQGDRVIRLGRANDADIVLSGETVSRVHAELRPTSFGWILVDVGSQHGTYVNGQRVTELRVEQPLVVYCGIEGSGATLVIDPIVPTSDASSPAAAFPVTNVAGRGMPADVPGAPGAVAARPNAERPSVPEPAGSGPPGLPGLPDYHPGFAATVSIGGSSANPAAGGGQQTGPDVLVREGGAERRFRHPMVITIGRHPECSVVVNDPVSSRLHGQIDPVPGGWVYTNRSREGTYVDGRRLDSLKLEDPVTLRLGHPTAGPEVIVTPLVRAADAASRITRKDRRTRLRVVGALAAAAVIVSAGVIGAFALRDDNPPSDQLSASELNAAKLATVQIYAQSQTTDGHAVAWTGSGSIITSTGMILTNAHVAEPQAEGLADRYGPAKELNPKFLQISLIETPNDSPADPAYRARVVVSDGHIDAAVIQIYATIDGDPLPGPLDLPTVPIGDSDTLRTGDEVTILGFPAISQSAGVSVTRGVISAFIDDPKLGDRSEIDTDARIAPGNSGGLAVNNNGEIIGIPSALYTLQGSPVASGRIRPINIVKPLIASH